MGTHYNRCHPWLSFFSAPVRGVGWGESDHAVGSAEPLACVVTFDRLTQLIVLAALLKHAGKAWAMSTPMPHAQFYVSRSFSPRSHSFPSNRGQSNTLEKLTRRRTEVPGSSCCLPPSHLGTGILSLYMEVLLILS